ncbi:MAG: HAMP domain-containing histidine kinase [Treponema sp.]|nr:HAMP domain-containing histidine kinase [Treponema sp.]MBP5751626.1 HAMP domain-containing histidine kinase [Treponema sp.]
MKIRTQLNILILGIILIPLASLIALPVYHYATSSERRLLKGYKEIRRMEEYDLSEDDWEMIRNEIKNIPPTVQVAFYYDYSILLSNMPELKAGTIVTPGEIWNFITSSNSEYDYQMQAPMMERRGFGSYGPEVIVISRSKVRPSQNRRWNRFTLPFFIGVLVFELFCITLIIILSKTISSSITLLQQNTQKIADGALDTKLEQPKHSVKSNEITSLTESLERMRVSLKDEQERRNKFIMGISHDLRTPVALIKGYSEAITDGVVGDMDEIKKSLGIVETKADQLESMINDLINYVKLNNADWLQTLEPISLKPLLENFASSSKSTAEVYKRNIVIEIDVDENLKVPMDKNLVNRVLENLFSNALRYTRDGDSITISCIQKKDSVVVSVTDTGIGMEEKDLQRIFDLFYRATNSRREQGMGIGLSVVKTVIDAHGWKIGVESELGKGSSFIITIPLENALVSKSL